MRSSHVAAAFLLASVALVTALACSSGAGSKTVNVETSAIQSVHLVVQAEKTAYENGAFDKTHHRTYLTALKRVLDHESALNDSLIAWTGSGQSVTPTVVVQAIADLQLIAADVATLPKTGALQGTLATALSQMTPGGGGAEIDLTAK